MLLDMQHWKPCPVFPDRYLVSDKGEVYSVVNDALSERDLGEVTTRIYGKRSAFSHKIIHDDEVMSTIQAGHSCLWRYTERTQISIEDIINCSTFPQDYDFGQRSFANVNYICGMSVPPIMVKRLITRLIDTGVFNPKF